MSRTVYLLCLAVVLIGGATLIFAVDLFVDGYRKTAHAVLAVGSCALVVLNSQIKRRASK